MTAAIILLAFAALYGMARAARYAVGEVFRIIHPFYR